METLASVKTEQNISIVQKAYENFGSGNVQGVAEACTDDVVWGSYDNKAVPFAGNFHGKKGVVDFFTTLGGAMDYQQFDTRDFFAVADKVFVKGYQKATVKSTGKVFAHDFLMEFGVTNGKISHFFAYVDTRDEAVAFTK